MILPSRGGDEVPCEFVDSSEQEQLLPGFGNARADSVGPTRSWRSSAATSRGRRSASSDWRCGATAWPLGCCARPGTTGPKGFVMTPYPVPRAAGRRRVRDTFAGQICLERVFGEDVVRCPRCRWRRHMISAITDQKMVRKVLERVRATARRSSGSLGGGNPSSSRSSLSPPAESEVRIPMPPRLSRLKRGWTSESRAAR